MLKVVDEKGNLKNLMALENGALRVATESVASKERVFLCDFFEVTGDMEFLMDNRLVTEVMIANYSEDTSLLVTEGTDTYCIGAGLAVELPMNRVVERFGMRSESDMSVKVQLVVKGVQ